MSSFWVSLHNCIYTKELNTYCSMNRNPNVLGKECHKQYSCKDGNRGSSIPPYQRSQTSNKFMQKKNGSELTMRYLDWTKKKKKERPDCVQGGLELQSSWWIDQQCEVEMNKLTSQCWYVSVPHVTGAFVVATGLWCLCVCVCTWAYIPGSVCCPAESSHNSGFVSVCTDSMCGCLPCVCVCTLVRPSFYFHLNLFWH